MAVALDQFIRRVSESSVISKDEITALLAALPAETQPADGEALAKLLVKEKKLTRYQAEQIYTGKGKSLIVGNNVILDKIGAGGMGQVFKARHRRMDRLVAVKLLPPEVNKDEEAIQRFHREVKAAAKLMHPNIVAAYDADETPGGVHFLVMEYVAGKDLAHLAANERNLPIPKVLQFILQAAKGLAYAHENGVVHRDIKPANLLLDDKGTVKILDMGLARLHDAAQAKDGLTKSGDVMGTVDYMAPEQAFDTHSVDARADIYSLGCTLYRLLTNVNLYDGESIVQKLMAHQSKPIPSLMQRRNDVSFELQQAFEMMVAKSADDRFQNMGQVITALQSVYDSLTISHAPQPSKSDSKLQALIRGLTGGVSTKPGNGSPTSAAATKEKPQVVSGDPALEATINLSNPSQVTDPVSDRSINVARTLARQPPLKKKPSGPWGRSRTALLASGAGGVLLMLLTIWVIIKDKDGKEVTRVKVPEGGSVKVKEGQPRKHGDALVAGANTETTFPNIRDTDAPRLMGSAPPPAEAPFNAEQAKAHQEAWAKHLGVKVETENSIGMKMRLIPPGEFLMGASDSDTDATPQEKPQHRVHLTTAFAMSATETTNRQFRRFVEATEYVTQAESDTQGAFDINQKGRRSSVVWNNSKFSESGQDDRPVRCVSWEDARRFCEWLSQTERRVYRLPTEAEWEYACRAGTVTRYSFGNQLTDTPSPPGSNAAPLLPVAQLPANPFGLFDMHGNVHEMCWDSGRTFTSEPVTDPRGSLMMNTPAVVRGGSVASDKSRLRSSHRYLTDARQFPEKDFATILKGFRVVAEIGAPAGESHLNSR